MGGATRMSEGDVKIQNGKIAIDFIDPLFAVVMHISFTRIMEETDNLANLSLLSPLQIGIIFLGYITLIWSWVGYHLSIRNKPIKLETKAGQGRFVFDVILLICYWILVVSFDDLSRAIWFLAIIYWIFVVWDQLKWSEHENATTSSREQSTRYGVSTFWALVFTLIALINHFCPRINDWAFLAIAIIATVLYRLHKYYLRPACVLNILSFHPVRQGKR